jgi:hypothetical protein
MVGLNSKRMRKLFASFCLAATVVFARAGDPAQVGGIINGKPLPKLPPDVRQKLEEQSIKLLESCRFADLHSTNDVKRVHGPSFVHFIFANPVDVQEKVGKAVSPGGKVKLEIKDMVITLPLASGGIWVQSDQGTSYFAKFDHQIAQALEQLLKEAQTR